MLAGTSLWISMVSGFAFYQSPINKVLTQLNARKVLGVYLRAYTIQKGVQKSVVQLCVIVLTSEGTFDVLWHDIVPRKSNEHKMSPGVYQEMYNMIKSIPDFPVHNRCNGITKWPQCTKSVQKAGKRYVECHAQMASRHFNGSSGA